MSNYLTSNARAPPHWPSAIFVNVLVIPTELLYLPLPLPGGFPSFLCMMNPSHPTGLNLKSHFLREEPSLKQLPHDILPFVLGVLTARILEWFAFYTSSGPCFVRTLHYDLSVLGGPVQQGS